MKVVLPLNGAINSDANPLYLKEGEVLSRSNCRVSSTLGGRFGVNVSIKGMREIEANLPSGNNLVIGAVEDAERDQIIFANYNDNDNHGIYKLRNDTVTALSTGSFWNFDFEKPVDMDILGDHVRLTDNFNPPRKLNIVDVGTPTADNIQIAVRFPKNAPTFVFGSDTTKKTNKMLGKAFQFAYLYVYDDDTYSVLSPYSEVAVSPNVFSNSGTYTDSSLGNFVTITFDAGATDVKEVVLVGREANIGDWFIVERYKKDSEGAYAALNVDFYNDVAREANPYTTSILYYSDVPRLAGTVTSVKNRIALGNVLKGYDAPEVDFTITVEYEDVELGSVSETMSNEEGTNLSDYFVRWTIPDTIEAGQVFKVSFSGTYLEGTKYDFDFSYSFSVAAGSGDTATSIINAFSADITSKGNLIVTKSRTENLITVLPYIDLVNKKIGVGFYGVVTIGFLGTREYSYSGSFTAQTITSGVNTYKAGSYYNVAMVDCDSRSRTAGAVGTKSVYIPHSFERDFADAYKSAVLKFTINDSSAEDWVDHYKFVVTESVSFTGVFNMIIGSEVIETTVDDRKVFAINIPDNAQYEFVNGDYAIIESSDGSTISAQQKIVLGTRTVVYDDTDTEQAGYWLIVPNDGATITDTLGTVLTVYRPKDEVSKNIFFEDSETYLVTSEVRQTLTGYIRSGDAWISNRWFVISNADRASTGITLDTGSSGVVDIGLNLGGGEYLKKEVTFDTDYETTARRFVYENSQYFWANGFIVGHDGAKIYLTDNTGDYAILVPYVNNISGDLDGTTDPVADVNNNIQYPSVVENFYIDIDNALRAYSRGRAITEATDLGEIRLQDVVWSDPYLDNTKINGTSMFTSLNREQLDEKDGAIRRVLLVGEVLKVIQDNKETSLYVGKAKYADGDGNIQTIRTGDFIGDAYPSVDDYGSRFFYSIVKNDRNLYYWDGDKGQVIRSSPNGQVAISDYGKKSEFLQIKDRADAAYVTDSRSLKIVSHFDEKNNEFVILFDIRGNVETWCFREGDNAWVQDLDYTNSDGDSPTMFASIGSQVYSFLENVWKHEANNAHNTFYGDFKPLSVTGCVNTSPREEKCLLAVETDSNRALAFEATSPIAETRTLGQKTILYPASFRGRDGSFTSRVGKNILTVSGEDINRINSGQDMTGKYFEVKFTDNTATECEFRLVTVNITINN